MEIKYTIFKQGYWDNLICVQLGEMGKQQTLLEGVLTNTGFAVSFFLRESDHIPKLLPTVCLHQEAPYSSAVTFPERY